MSKQFDWVDFYAEFAHILLQYKDKRNELVSKVLQIYDNTGINLPTLEFENKIVDIDPFTIFGLFNKSSMTETNRIKIITAIAELFEVNAIIPSSFESIPVLNNQNATFYLFSYERGEKDIDDLWDLFQSALWYADNPNPESFESVSKYFDIAINKKGNGNSKITMGLYWIAPDHYLNLDKRNTWYIYESGKIPPEVTKELPAVEAKISAEKYFLIVRQMKNYLQSGKSELKNFKELSYEAWRYSEKVNEENKKKQANANNQQANSLIDLDEIRPIHYWLYAPGESAKEWDEFYDAGIMGIGWSAIGDLSQYSSIDEMKQAMKDKIDPSKSHKNAAYATWQFANEMKPGDIVFVKKGLHLLVGRGVIESDYEYHSSRSHYKNIRSVNWTHKGEWPHPGQAVMKTLTDITPYKDYVDKLNALFPPIDDDETNGSDIPDAEDTNAIKYPAYTPENFLNDVYMSKENYETLVALIHKKKNVILQGPPGVGKTFAAKRLAYSIIGSKDQERVMLVQFHQSYSYEDFIMGFRPTETGFELRRGAFYNFCKSAMVDSDNDYFFIIDEINRGNLSKIFGELFMLIENDKRGLELQLLYSDEKFSVPENVHIIGMMNTADRSLAMLDYALRRRFAYYDMKPGFDSDGFREYRKKLNSPKFDKLIQSIEDLNNAIASDETLGEGFLIGHSYLCNIQEATDQELSSIVEFELIPLLKEYWFDEPVKVKDWSNILRSALK